MEKSKSRKIAIIALSLSLISFILLIIGIVLFVINAKNGNDFNEENPIFEPDFGVNRLIYTPIEEPTTSSMWIAGLSFSVFALLILIPEIILTIIAAIKTSHSTAKILSIVGAFIFPIIQFIGLSLIIKHNQDKSQF
ncbi:hypothetical protein [Metamycoplasma cloacale]|nr:hypothetical protein [Metamycoplasma cloacale]